MPGLIQETPFKTITVKKLHPTFGAEIEGVDFDNLTDEQFGEIKAALTKYGFAVFRNTGLTDDTHVAFSRRLGELDNIARYVTPGRKLRYRHLELFDASNLDADGEIVKPDSPRAHYNKGNALFHTDSSFNPRRASYSLLRAVALPPPGQGGDTEFADARAAWDDLDRATRDLLLPPGGDDAPPPLVGAFSLSHSRKAAAPDFFRDLDVASAPMARHRLAQPQPQLRDDNGGPSPSPPRVALYVGAHLHHIEGLPADYADAPSPSPSSSSSSSSPSSSWYSPGSDALVRRLNAHVARPANVARVAWRAPGDLVAWDNRVVLHRATGGAFEGRFARDVRRTTVHDDGPHAWGLNRVGEAMPGFAVDAGPAGEKRAAAGEVSAS